MNTARIKVSQLGRRKRMNRFCAVCQVYFSSEALIINYFCLLEATFSALELHSDHLQIFQSPDCIKIAILFLITMQTNYNDNIQQKCR